MYYEWIQKNKRMIVVSSIVLFIALVIWGLAIYIPRIGKVGVTIMAVPRDASVLINNQEVGSGTHWVSAGTYTISASKEGFKKQSKSVVVSGEKKQNAVALSLTPETDAAKAWADANVDAYRENEAYGAIEARSNGEYFKLKNPVSNVLPYSDPYYSIAYEANGNDVTIVISTPSPRYRYLAIQKFRELGFNPTDYKIQFEDFVNPFGGKNE